MNAQDQARLLQTLQRRYTANPHRHEGLAWEPVLARLEGNTAALKALQSMESSGGEAGL